MVIDINLLKRQGKTSEKFKFPFEIDKNLALSPDYEFKNAVLKCEVELKEDYVVVFGEISYTVVGDCVRCLEKTEKPVKVEFDEIFSERPMEDEYSYKSGRLDLGELIKDNVLFSQPTVIYCKDDCDAFKNLTID